jgi:hypothetical protein
MQRVFTLLLSAALVVSGLAGAICARDCAEGGAARSNISAASTDTEEKGFCHGGAATSGMPNEHSPADSPLAPQPQKCAGHAQSILVARPVTKTIALAPQATSAIPLSGRSSQELLIEQFSYGSLSSDSSPPASDPLSLRLILRI